MRRRRLRGDECGGVARGNLKKEAAKGFEAKGWIRKRRGEGRGGKRPGGLRRKDG